MIRFQICLLLAVLPTTKAWADRPPVQTQLPYLSHTVEPSRQAWQTFMLSRTDRLEELWNFHQAGGHRLKDWHWGWRLGWIRVCSKSYARKRPMHICSGIVREGLRDKALLVRAEAASETGRQFQGKPNMQVIEDLKRTAANPANFRNGTPVIVHRRILAALYAIGGESAFATGDTIANTHPDSLKFWQSLKKLD